MSYLPELILQTESVRDPFRVFLLTIFGRFLVDLPLDRFLGPVRAICIYLGLTASISLGPHACACPLLV